MASCCFDVTGILLDWVSDAHLRCAVLDTPGRPFDRFLSPEYLQDKIMKVNLFDTHSIIQAILNLEIYQLHALLVIPMQFTLYFSVLDFTISSWHVERISWAESEDFPPMHSVHLLGFDPCWKLCRTAGNDWNTENNNT